MLPAWGFYRRETFLAAILALGLGLAACRWTGWLHHPQWIGRAVLISAATAVAALCGWHLSSFGSDIGTWIVLLVAAAIVVAVASGLWNPAPDAEPILTATALVLAGLGVVADRLFYPEVPAALRVIHAATVTGFLALAALALTGRSLPRPDRSFWAMVAVLFVCGASLRAGAVIASPDPVIDVYVWLSDAPQALLDHKNPYTVDYPNIYASARAAKYGMRETGPAAWRLPAYPPVPIVLALPFRAVGLDVRYANVLCDLLAAAVILAAGCTRQCQRAAALSCGAYLLFPGAPFLTEQGWYEPMIAALLGSGLLLAERGWRVGYLLSGLGLTAKQYGVALMIPLVRAAGRSWRMVVLGLLGAATLMAPFFLWQPQAFIDVIFRLHLGRPTQFNSITLHSGADDLLGVQPPRWLFWVLAGLLIGWIALREPRTGVAAALWTGTALLGFSLCHTQGYFNYFYLCEYLWLLGIVGLAEMKANPLARERGKI